MAASTSAPATEAWRLMHRLFTSQRRRFWEIANEAELSPPQMGALLHLDPGRPLPMSDLADALACDNSNVTGIVDRLEARGLVERRPDERDRRVKMLALTDAGAEVRARVHERMGQPPPAIAGLSAADARTLRDVLRRALGPEN